MLFRSVFVRRWVVWSERRVWREGRRGRPGSGSSSCRGYSTSRLSEWRGLGGGDDEKQSWTTPWWGFSQYYVVKQHFWPQKAAGAGAAAGRWGDPGRGRGRGGGEPRRAARAAGGGRAAGAAPAGRRRAAAQRGTRGRGRHQPTVRRCGRATRARTLPAGPDTAHLVTALLFRPRSSRRAAGGGDETKAAVASAGADGTVVSFVASQSPTGPCRAVSLLRALSSTCVPSPRRRTRFLYICCSLTHIILSH